MVDPSGKQTFELVLAGCRPEPLGSYLKALGVLRLVGEQKDAEALGYWRGEHFVLQSSLDRGALERFFLEEWRPTPVIAPWNGGSGFYPKDNCAAADAIVAFGDPRLAPLASSIAIARSFIRTHGWTERPSDDSKVLLISTMRAQLPDEALAWLDAAVMLGDDRLLFPPLLGTGGNDGHLEFSNNYQQRVVEVLSTRSPTALGSALFGDTTSSRFKGVMGQYLPAAHERTNPWDFLLLIEGALLFGAAATRRYETSSSAMLAFPFHARAAGGLATIADTDEAESRDELWLPLWQRPASLRAIRRLFAEGRATVGTCDRARPAATALDFARAVTALGVDRGVDGFCRIGFHKRNGKSYFGTPLGRFQTGDVRSARLLDDIDAWFDRFRHKASGKTAPARVRVALRRLEQAMFDAVLTGNLGPVLLELGGAEQALAESLSFAETAFLGPVPRLQPAWADAVSDGSAEQRLAATLAARPGMRARLIPLDRNGRGFGRADDASVVFSNRALVENLHALLAREDIEARQGRFTVAAPWRAHCTLADVTRFIAAEIDDVLVDRWLRSFVLIDGGVSPALPPGGPLPPVAFAVLALVHGRRVRDLELPRTTGLLSRAIAGDAVGATERAIRRLNASAQPFPVPAIAEPFARMRRIAAALAFPLSSSQARTLECMVLPATDPTTTNSFESQEHS